MTAAALKFVHIAALALWCGGLLILPMLLARADNPVRAGEAARMRVFAHHAYNACISPAAVIATIAGGALMFVRWLFEPWMFAKLGLIGLLVIIHTYLGHCVTRLGETGTVRPLAPPALVLGAGMLVMGAILIVVLAKPPITVEGLPIWMRVPAGRQLPLPAVPS